MEYPIYIEETEKGKLTVTQEGLRTRFTVKCEKVQKIIRLSVFGGGKSAYLGVLCPEGDYLTLSKSFSPNEMRSFPEKIEYAADRQQCIEENDRIWRRTPDGCLITSEGGTEYIAIPAAGKRLEKTGLVRHIDGGDYLVFRR